MLFLKNIHLLYRNILCEYIHNDCRKTIFLIFLWGFKVMDKKKTVQSSYTRGRDTIFYYSNGAVSRIVVLKKYNNNNNEKKSYLDPMKYIHMYTTAACTRRDACFH